MKKGTDGGQSLFCVACDFVELSARTCCARPVRESIIRKVPSPLHQAARTEQYGFLSTVLWTACMGVLLRVTRTGIEYQKGVIPVKPGMSNSPPDCRIEVGSIPIQMRKKRD